MQNFMTADNGDLFRVSDCETIREGFARHYPIIDNGRQLRASLRAGEYSWPGGYACFFLTSDGGILSFDAVRDNLASVLWSIRNACDDGWRVIGTGTTAECDDSVFCDHTGLVIE